MDTHVKKDLASSGFMFTKLNQYTTSVLAPLVLFVFALTSSPVANAASPNTYTECLGLSGSTQGADGTDLDETTPTFTHTGTTCSEASSTSTYYIKVDPKIVPVITDNKITNNLGTTSTIINNDNLYYYGGTPNYAATSTDKTFATRALIYFVGKEPYVDSQQKQPIAGITVAPTDAQGKTFNFTNNGTLSLKNFNSHPPTDYYKLTTAAVLVESPNAPHSNERTNHIHANITNAENGSIIVENTSRDYVKDGFIAGINVNLRQDTYNANLTAKPLFAPDTDVTIDNQGSVAVNTQELRGTNTRSGVGTLTARGILGLGANVTIDNGVHASVDVKNDANAQGIILGAGAGSSIRRPETPNGGSLLKFNNEGNVTVYSKNGSASGVLVNWYNDIQSSALHQITATINNSGKIEASTDSSDNENPYASPNNPRYAAKGLSISTLNVPQASGSIPAAEYYDQAGNLVEWVKGYKAATESTPGATRYVYDPITYRLSYYSNITVNNSGEIKASTNTTATDKYDKPDVYGVYFRGTTTDTFTFNNLPNSKITGDFKVEAFKPGATRESERYQLTSIGSTNITQEGIINGNIILASQNDVVTLKQGSKTIGDISFGKGVDTFTWSGGTLHGGVDLGEGKGTATVIGVSEADIANSNVTHIVAGTAGKEDVLTLDNVKLSGASFAADDLSKGINFGHGWDSIILNNNAELTLTGNLSIDDPSLAINSGSRLLVGNGINSTIGTSNSGLIVTNGGTIDFTNGTSGATDTLTINGDYVGNSGKLKMNTTWNTSNGNINGLSASDKLVINGNASGSTTVIPVKADGTENIIEGNIQQVAQAINSVPTVTVSGTASKDAFTGTAATSGAAAAQLASRTTGSGGTEYYWTINAGDPTTPATPTTPADTGPVIYADSVSGYTQMPAVNMNLGYTTLGSLHERRSENQMLAWDNCGHACSKEGGVHGQSWGRVVAESINQDGKKRLNFDTKQYLLQIGHDFAINQNHETGSRTHIGGYFSYGTADTKFSDNFHAVNGLISSNTRTGTGTSKAYTVGAYRTAYDKNGSYLDLVGQYSYISNKYSATSSHADNDANGLGLSAEVGRPYAINHSQWLIEPQAQLLYQYLDLSDINDGVRHVKYDAKSGARGRVGARLAYNGKSNHSYMTNTFYVTANVLHDFNQDSAASALIGSDKVSENYDDTWGEFGVGMQLPVKKNIYLYGDARYAHSLNNDAGKREGVRGNLGVKFTFE